jgi:hypothetical protein
MARAELGVIGWREWVALPDLGVTAVKAKVDTGARSSALHAWDIELVDRDDGMWATFAIHPLRHAEDVVVTTQARVVDEREVRSSNGEVEVRPIIATELVLGGRSFTAELSLTRRDEMGFRLLLGRTAVRRRFLVNPGRSFLGGGDVHAPPPS